MAIGNSIIATVDREGYFGLWDFEGKKHCELKNLKL